MKRYIKPTVKEQQIKLNTFFRDSPFGNFGDPFSNLFDVGTVYAVTVPGPPNSGTAGLKDRQKFVKNQL